MRRRLVIIGQSREGLELLAGLEANPEVEIVALVADDPDRAARELREIDPGLAARLSPCLGSDLEAALATPGLAAAIDADATPAQRRRLERVREFPVTTPMLARLLFAFGPADAMSKPDLLQALREVLDSYDLTLDWRALLERVLQIAVTSTGADRGSVMLWDPNERALRVEVALGIEEEVRRKIRVQVGEGIAGRAFGAQRAIRLDGKADRSRYQITRERDDVESAISAPLVHGDESIGVLNLSHGRDRGVFDDEDLEFVKELANLDARVIARAQEYHGLLRESVNLRTEAVVRRLLTGDLPLAERLERTCVWLAESLRGGVCRLYLFDTDQRALLLQAASTRIDPISMRERIALGEGISGSVAESQRAVTMSHASGAAMLAFPLVSGETLLGAICLEGRAGDEPAGALAERVHAAAQALASELSEALRAARLERASRRGTFLAERFAAMGVCREPRELFALVTQTASELLESQDAVLRLLDEEASRYRVVSWNGLDAWRKAPLAELEKKLSSDALRERRPLCVADLAGEPDLAHLASGVTTAMVQPLLRDGRAIGSLTLLGKVPDEPLLGERFGADDQAILLRLVQHAQVALSDLRERGSPAQRHDPLTGLPGAQSLRDRIQEEVARSSSRGHRFALVQLTFSGLATRLEKQRQGEGDRLAVSLAEGLRRVLRDFDVLARPAPDRLTVVAPEHEGDVASLIATLCRAAREVLSSQGGAADDVEIRAGYATYPDDGEDGDALLTRAAARHVEEI